MTDPRIEARRPLDAGDLPAPVKARGQCERCGRRDIEVLILSLTEKYCRDCLNQPPVGEL